MHNIRKWMRLVEADRHTISDVIRSELAKTGMRPSVVNDGYCGFLADKVVAILGKGKVLSTDDTPVNSKARHEWVYVDGKHYDSETVNGVADPNDLIYFRRQARKAKRFG